MRRADRLFQIVQLLRRRRSATTAARIAERLGVSERTVYRDIQDLVTSGTPIDGAAGVGYRLRSDYELPPLMFTRDEVQALVLGARIVRQFGDPALARASEAILDKVAAVLPKDLEPLLSETKFYVPSSRRHRQGGDALQLAREALLAQRRLQIAYVDERDQASERTVRPLGILFWGKGWMLSSWCELRQDFRSFRLDRVRRAILQDPFEEEPGKTLKDLFVRYGPDALALLEP
jgi:predicted DNA-binding transcriptional regulator YafY